MNGWSPGTFGWCVTRLHYAKVRLAWEIARALRINHLFGVPDSRALPAQPSSHKGNDHG